ncbi:MAG: hypothetical protein PHP42_11865 [Bacteroidota bacterium]|nr:hypothetical protein [Bacteroidota bacterium]
MKKTRIILFALLLTIPQYNSQAEDQKGSMTAWIKGGLRDCFKLIVSPNGKYILSITSLGAQLWSKENGTLIKMLPNHLGYGNYPFVFSTNSDNIYYADSAKIKCWDIEKDSILVTFVGHHNIVRSLSLSKDGGSLLSAGDDSLVIIWNIKESIGTHKIHHLQEYTWNAYFTGDDKYIVVVSGYGTTIHDKNSGTILSKFRGSISSISASGNVIAFSNKQQSGSSVTPGIILYTLNGKKIKTLSFSKENEIREFTLTKDGRYLLACCENRFIKIYDANNGLLLRTILGPIWSPLTISNNGKYILAVLENSRLGIWDIESGVLETQSLNTEHTRIERTAIFENGSYVAFYCSSHKLCLWDTKVAQEIKTLTTNGSHVSNICSNGQNKLSASVSQDGKAYIWETASGKNIYSLQYDDNLQIHNLVFSHNGKYIVTIASRMIYDPGSSRGNYYTDSINVSLWDAYKGEWLKEYFFDQEERPSGVGFTIDDKNLLVTNNDRIQTYNVQTGKLIRESRPYTYGTISPKSKYSVESSFHDNGDVAVWNILKDTIQFIRNAHNGFTRTVSFSDDESILVSSGQDDGMLKVWKMPEGKLQNSFNMNVPQVHYGCVSPSGKYFVGGSITGEINVWELESGRVVQTFMKYPCYISSIAWSSDETLIFAGFLDGTVIALRNIKLSGIN